MSKFEQIYDIVDAKIANIEENLKANNDIFSDYDEEKLSTLQDDILRVVKNVSKAREKLKINAEWKTYTIALYGETNAGKSTLIEALRIYFKDDSKVKSWAKFDKFKAKYPNLENLASEISQKEQDLKNLQDQKPNLWEKFKAFFGFGAKNSLNREIKALKKIQKQLDLHADGEIIGDGQGDFTKKNTTYHFEYKNDKFDILDVPGIEGIENAVIDEILKAIQKAHCVFFITPNPQPPQKGDEGKKGTLEKIKEHLGSQTEIYAIYNKKIHNPRQLSQNLFSEDEEKSLKVLDSKMSDVLQEHYKGHKLISARAAFLALSQHLNSKDQAEKAKFLNEFSEDDILNHTGFKDFVEFLARDLITEIPNKIKRSNYNKIAQNLGEIIDLLEKIKEQLIEPVVEMFERETKAALSNIDDKIESLKSGFIGKFDLEIMQYQQNVREKIYKEIDYKIDNDVFRSKFEQILSDESPKIETSLENISKNIADSISNDIKYEIENLKRRMENGIKDLSELKISSKFDSNIQVDIKSGIDKMGFVVSAGSTGLLIYGIVNWWNPTGWLAITAAVASVLASLIGLVKSVLGFFSKDYRASQQKNAVEENLSKIKNEITSNLNAQKVKFFEAFQNELDKIKDKFDTSKNELQNFIEFCEQGIREFENLKLQIQEGEIL